MLPGPTISFDDAQRALVTLLRSVKEDGWATSIANCNARTFGGLFDNPYGLSDLILSRIGHHDLPDWKEPLANALLRTLITICRVSAESGPLTTDEVIHVCGARLVAAYELEGSRCRACGHSEISTNDAQRFLAPLAIGDALRDGIGARQPAEALLRLWHAGPDGQPFERHLQAQLARSGIVYKLDHPQGIMRPCSWCGSQETCRYRWHLDGDRFVPSDDNLP
jgi:hypothetical protein